jgi:F-box interacting protein
MHLQKSSSLNPNFILKPFLPQYPINAIVSLPVSRILDNPPSITLSGNTYRTNNLVKDDENCRVVGSCNGLICLCFTSDSTTHVNFSFRIWNPATRTISDKLGFLCENKPILGIFKFTFGYDCLTGTYKLVWLHSVQNRGIWKTNVRVFSLGGSGDDECCWRNISSPFICGDGVHLNGTVNWLTLSEDLSVLGGSIKPLTPHVDFFRIASLDLSTETYTQLLHPEGFNEVPCAESNLRVLLDCLCFSHDFRKTEFVIWQMKEFSVRESWTQLFRIRYFDLQMPNVPIEVQYLDESTLLPLYVSKNGDTAILTNEEDDKAIIYNQRDNRVVRTTTISNDIHWFSAIDYVESLVPTPWK